MIFEAHKFFGLAAFERVAQCQATVPYQEMQSHITAIYDAYVDAMKIGKDELKTFHQKHGYQVPEGMLESMLEATRLTVRGVLQREDIPSERITDSVNVIRLLLAIDEREPALAEKYSCKMQRCYDQRVDAPRESGVQNTKYDDFFEQTKLPQEFFRKQ